MLPINIPDIERPISGEVLDKKAKLYKAIDMARGPGVEGRVRILDIP